MINESTTKFERNTLENGKQVVNVTYSGKLAEAKADDVYVRTGVGDDWADLKEVKMTFDSTTGTYSAIVEANSENDKINFCFKNEAGEWDNNDGANYTAEPITEATTTADATDATETWDATETTAETLDAAAHVEQQLEQSLMVIEESKKSLVDMVNEPINFGHIIDLIARLFDSIKEALTTLINGKKGHEDDLLL